MVFSFYSGSDLLHVISRLSKKIRAELPESGLLNQNKVLRVKKGTQSELIFEKIAYGLRLADVIDFVLDSRDYPQHKLTYICIFSALNQVNRMMESKTYASFTLQGDREKFAFDEFFKIDETYI